jgi:hypothetical protein
MEYSKLASGMVSSLGAATPVVLPFIPNFIEISNATRAAAAVGVTRAYWMTDMGQGAAFVETTAAGPATGSSYISSATGGGFSTFQGGIAFQYGPVVKITSITGTSATVTTITTATPHGLITGNVVMLQSLYQTATTGMPQLADIPFVVTVTSPTVFTIQWNATGSNYTAITGGGLTNLPQMKQVLYPYLYYPGVNVISAITLGATTTVVTTAAHNYVVGQEVAFRIPTLWGTTQLNSLPNILFPGSPMYGFVIAVPNSNTVVVNINSVGFTAFNPNVPAIGSPGLTPAQIVAVGDNNSGSLLFGSASLTINGPAISGAFLNNTSMGFLIGASIAGSAADIVFWRAYLHDMNS